MIEITYEDNKLLVRFPYNELDLIKAKNIPDRRWVKSKKVWSCRPTLANIKYLEQAWPRAFYSKEANNIRNSVIDRENDRLSTLESKSGNIDTSWLDGVNFKMPPMKHQKIALTLAKDKNAFAYFMDQGTGKTKTLIDDAAYLYRKNEIDALIVITINSVKTNWVITPSLKDDPDDMDAIETHLPDDIPYTKMVWSSKQTKEYKKEWAIFEKDINSKDKRKLIILACNIESLKVGRAFKFYEDLCKKFRVMIAIDESTIIGRPGSGNTTQSLKLRKLCKYARILSGTPIIKSPLKAYSQFQFLDEDILGFGSFYSFRNNYCNMGGFEGRQVLSYKNLDDLQTRIATSSYRVEKKDCLDLPPQIFEKRRIELTDEQLKEYKRMQEELIAENSEKEIVEATIVLSQILRLQQIVGGYLPKVDGEGVLPIIPKEKNPKFLEVLNILENSGDQRVLIWSRFTHEINDLVDLLQEKGYNFLPFYGELNDKEKISTRKRFVRDQEIKGIVGNPAAGGLGIDEFKEASIVIYLSNSFDTEKRKQSEDRAHRKGSEKHESITYYDIIAPNTVDIKIMQVMRSNVKVSAAILKDEWKEWI